MPHVCVRCCETTSRIGQRFYRSAMLSVMGWRSKTFPHAVGVLLLRDDGSVYLTRSGSAPDYGFPWCAVEREDCSGRALGLCCGLTSVAACQILGHRLSPQRSLGHWFAGARKIFETTGWYFARDAKLGRERSNCMAARSHAAGDSIGLLGFLEAHDLFYDLERLVYFARWRIRAPRGALYDTRLYVARLAETEQSPRSSPKTGELWMTPDNALSLWRGHRLTLSFCTFSCLRALADFAGWDPLIAELRGGYTSGLNAP